MDRDYEEEGYDLGEGPERKRSGERELKEWRGSAWDRYGYQVLRFGLSCANRHVCNILLFTSGFVLRMLYLDTISIAP